MWASIYLALFPGAEEGRKSAWYTLFAHVRNYKGTWHVLI